MPATALDRVWPRYDAMRTELAVGQFADLINDARGFPTLDKVLDVSRRKSGNYTVRRPLEMGGAMAGCGEHVLTTLGGYGDAIGEAFQMRDDVLGIFGSPAVTGKPSGSDLAEHKATSVVAAAYHLADSPLRTPAPRADECRQSRRQRCPPLARPDRRNRRSGLDGAADRCAADTGVDAGRQQPHPPGGTNGLGRYGHGMPERAA